MAQTKQTISIASIARRRVLMAGGASALAPALGFAACTDAAHPSATSLPARQHGDRFVLSGRIEDAQSQPISGTTIAVSGDSSATATTDGDGRFVLTMNTPGNFGQVFVKVGGTQIKRIELHRSIAHVARDDAGVLRASVAILMV